MFIYIIISEYIFINICISYIICTQSPNAKLTRNWPSPDVDLFRTSMLVFICPLAVVLIGFEPFLKIARPTSVDSPCQQLLIVNLDPCIYSIIQYIYI